MSRLYPPQIEGVIPAFYGTTLVVPFIMNKTISKNEVFGIALKLKSIHNNEIVYQTQLKDLTQISFDKQQIYFTIPEKTCIIGTSYKLQIAYIDSSNQIGYYSTVGVVKYTAIFFINSKII